MSKVEGCTNSAREGLHGDEVNFLLTYLEVPLEGVAVQLM